MQSQLQFDLTNPSDKEVTVVLIPAMLRRRGLLSGKYPKEPNFEDIDGAVEIGLSNVVPKGGLTELNEYADQLIPIAVTAIQVGTDNLAQGMLNFIDNQYVEFKEPIVTAIDTRTTVAAGVMAIRHEFMQPWMSTAMRSMEMKLLPGQTVTIALELQMPDFSQIVALAAAKAAAAILPQQ
jgi:hypothetical protein